MPKVRIEIYSHDHLSAQIYFIEAALNKHQFKFIASQLLATGDNWRIYYHDENKWSSSGSGCLSNDWWAGEVTNYIKRSDKVTEIYYRPGVTDGLARTLEKMIQQSFNYVLSRSDVIDTAQLFVGQCKYIYNPLIQLRLIGSASDDFHLRVTQPFVHQASSVVKEVPVCDLHRYNKNNSLGLSNKAIAAIKEYFINLSRDPSDIELETLAQTWSEHCKHTIFSAPIDDLKEGLYSTYIKGATREIMQKKKDFCVSVFSDNAGAISFTEDWIVAAKVETHNSPSALEPFGGSMTGVVGVNRDILGFGKGAKPVANTYGFCFADPNKRYELFRDKQCSLPILQAQSIIDGVIKGVEVGGNCSGIPTTQGFVFYHERFIAKPLVFVGTIGISPRVVSNKPSHEKEPKNGDCIVIIGGGTGKDGMHGATFSSEALTDVGTASVVQIGDPITQKKLSDALIKEARGLDLYNAITDNGAGGLSSSVGEMGYKGFEVQLEKVPLKCPSMDPWEIWVSESQERMTLSVPPERYDELSKIMQKHDVPISRIGQFNDSGMAVVSYDSIVILNIDTEFLHNGNPVEHLKTAEVSVVKGAYPTDKSNLRNRDFISSQYDHEVQGGSVLKPLQGKGKVSADATVIRPVLSLDRGLALSQGLGVLLDDAMDPYYMAANAIDTAIRNLVVVGADPSKIALLDNFCWSDSADPKRLWQLKMAAKACYDYAILFEAPFISGKDSMFNDFKGYDAQGDFVHLTDPPTLLITAVGIVEDVKQCISLDAKFVGDLVYLLGENSSYNINADAACLLYKQLHHAIKRNLIASAISVNCGGLGHAMDRVAKGGVLSINFFHDKYSALLIEEYPSRVLVTVNPQNKDLFEELFKSCISIGVIAN